MEDPKLFLLQDENGEVSLTNDSRLPKPPRRQFPQLKWLQRIALLVFLLSPLVLLYFALMQSVAHSKASSCYSMARQIYQKAEEWTDLDASHQLTTDIASFSEVPQPDSLEAYMQKMFSGGYGWYAVVCDDAGELEFVLYSQNKMTEDQLTAVSFKETKAMFLNPFQQEHAIACYP